MVTPGLTLCEKKRKLPYSVGVEVLVTLYDGDVLILGYSSEK